MTANVYTHLLDGDLRVRDEHRSAAQESGLVGDEADALEYTDATENRVAAAVKALIQELEKTSTEECRKPELAQATEKVVSERLAAESGQNVPQMFRKTISNRPDSGGENEKGPETSSVPGLCSKLEMACPTGVEPVTFSSGG